MTFTNSGSTFLGGFTVGGGAESALFSSGMAEFDKKLDGIMEIRSPAVDEKLSIFRLEKRNLAKIRSEFRNLHKTVKISEILDKNLKFQRHFRCRNFGFLSDDMTEFGKKFNGMAESGTP